MGNLPNSRTSSPNPSDPVSSALTGEIEDCIIGAKRKAFSRTFYPKFIKNVNWIGDTPTVAGQIVVAYTSPGGSATGIFEIPFDVGDRFIGLKYWAAGNGTVDLSTAAVQYGSVMTASPTTIANWTDNNRAAAFGIVDVGAISTSPTFAPQLLAEGASLMVTIVTNAAGYMVGPWWAFFDRL